MYAMNYVPARDMKLSITGCCPPFNPAEWDGQTFIFHQKLFIRFYTHSALHIPVAMNARMKKVLRQISDAGATSPEFLMLSHELSPWRAEHYIAVSKEVPEADMVRLNGTYLSRVFDGPYKNIRLWRDELMKYVMDKGKQPLKTYFSYAMCPHCAKEYGHNYVVGFEQVF